MNAARQESNPVRLGAGPRPARRQHVDPVRGCVVVTMAVILSVAASVSAQTPRAIDLETAIELGRRHSWALADAADRAEAGQARAHAERGRLSPQIQLTARHSWLSEVPTPVVRLPATTPGAPAQEMPIGEAVDRQTSLRASVDQVLFSGGALWRAWQASRAAAAAADAGLSAARAEGDAATTAAFLAALQTQGMADAASARAGLLVRMLADGERLHATGRLSDLELANLRARAARAEAGAAGAAAAAAGADLGLRTRLGLSREEPLIWVSPDAHLPVSPDVEVWVGRALATHPLLTSARRGAEAAEAAARAARGGYAPRVALNAGIRIDNPNERYFPIETRFQDSWDVSLVASWEIWRGGRDHYRARAAAHERAIAGREAERLAEAVELALRRTLLQMEAGQVELKAAEAAANAADRALASARKLFAAGRIRGSEVLEAESLYAEAESGRLAAKAGVLQAWSEALRWLGGSEALAGLVVDDQKSVSAAGSP